jgi:hypothetical protein
MVIGTPNHFSSLKLCITVMIMMMMTIIMIIIIIIITLLQIFLAFEISRNLILAALGMFC